MLPARSKRKTLLAAYPNQSAQKLDTLSSPRTTQCAYKCTKSSGIVLGIHLSVVVPSHWARLRSVKCGAVATCTQFQSTLVAYTSVDSYMCTPILKTKQMQYGMVRSSMPINYELQFKLFHRASCIHMQPLSIGPPERQALPYLRFFFLRSCLRMQQGTNTTQLFFLLFFNIVVTVAFITRVTSCWEKSTLGGLGQRGTNDEREKKTAQPSARESTERAGKETKGDLPRISGVLSLK